MNAARLLCFAIATLLVAASRGAACLEQEIATKEKHTWRYIAFAKLPNKEDNVIVPTLRLENAGGAGLRFVVSYHVMADKKPIRNVPPERDDVAVRIHYPTGGVVDAPPPVLWGLGVGDSRSVTYPLVYDIPWSENFFDEAWIELRLDKQIFWLEVPYGFTRNPADRLTPGEPRQGRPGFAHAMKSLGANDRIVPWLHVNYDLGEIQNGWRLSFNHANPFDAESEIVLYRDDSVIGKSMYLWDLHSPRTSIRIKQPDGHVLESMCMSVRLHDDGMRRSDSFKFNRNPSNDARCWGTVQITVDDKNYDCVVPSSLFKYVHGVADPYHKAMIPRKPKE